MEKPKDARGAPPLLSSGVKDGADCAGGLRSFFPTRVSSIDEYPLYRRYIRLDRAESSRPTSARNHFIREDPVGCGECGEFRRRVRHHTADRGRTVLDGAGRPDLWKSHLG